MRKRLKVIDEKLRSRIRVIIWKQWKNSYERIRSLKKLGIPEEKTKSLTYCRKGLRYIGCSELLQIALSNKRLKQRGILFTTDYYLKVHTEI